MITKLTAMIIACRDDIIITCGGPDKAGKWMGWITLNADDRYRPILNSEAIYNSPEEAKQAMQKTVDEIRYHELYKGEAAEFSI